MILLILGLILWTGAHLWKRLAPDHRAGFGDKGKGIVALSSFAAIVLMVLGYRAADGAVYWGRSGALTGINNLLMLLAFYLFAASGKGTRVTKAIRHPQLAAVVVWATAHILVNGDVPSFVLFGGLAIWALTEMVLINRAQGPRGAYHAPPVKSEVIAIVAAVVVTIAVMGVHHLLGGHAMGVIYRFLTEDDTAAFCHKVSDALAKGWVLHGDPQYTFDHANGVLRCGQAVTKEVDDAYHPDMKLGQQ